MNVKKSVSVKQTSEKSEGVFASGLFRVVGIGASAGGLEALGQFFGNMPGNTGMAFVVIQHLDPTHTGLLPELLQRFTSMPVIQATDGLRTQPNHLYVIPPGKSLSIRKHTLFLLDPAESRGHRLPIDLFFLSLAADLHEKSIGIILSGMGSDGCLGLKAIKKEKGLVLIQDPLTARYDGMPGSAVKAVEPDSIAAAGELPARLIALMHHKSAALKVISGPETNEIDLDKIVVLLHEHTGHDFSMYKTSTLFRRIERRKGVHRISTTSGYVRLLQENPAEIDILFKELLIGVTSFFRDPGVWDFLRTHILPDFITSLPSPHIVRAWVPACSTGEEAYTLAMVFTEALESLPEKKAVSIQIFATDLDKEAVDFARKGVFPASIRSAISPERLNRFFIPEEETFRVKSSVRDCLVFAHQDVIKDPPFTRLGMLSCRNMLIYMEPELQTQLLQLFHYSLNPGGILILGSAETPGSQQDGFSELNSKLKLFRRSEPNNPAGIAPFLSAYTPSTILKTKPKNSPAASGNIQSITEQVLIQRFLPASTLVNENGDILYITGRTGKYLEPAAGKANLNIYAMARDGIREALPAALRQVSLNAEPLTIKNIRVGSGKEQHRVNITLQRLEKPDAVQGMILLLFTDTKDTASKKQSALKPEKSASPEQQTAPRTELMLAHEALQHMREEMQTSQEELRSANEELQSTNEELQSTNEELTTSKEEMQSLNEELQTMNAELQSKVADLMNAADDMKNLLNSTQLATLFLDRELNIRKFTEQATHLFKLRNSDVGRPISDLTTLLLYPEMEEHALKVLRTLIPLEMNVATQEGLWFDVRIMPYRTTSDYIDGLVLTFTDITVSRKLEIELKKANEALRTKETATADSGKRFRGLFETATEGILLLDAVTGMILEVNPVLTQLLGYHHDGNHEMTVWENHYFKDIFPDQRKFKELQHKDYEHINDQLIHTAGGKKIHIEMNIRMFDLGHAKVMQCQIKVNH
jgi:two-component system, chemotaxis family, CheB/CheR fusion protein